MTDKSSKRATSKEQKIPKSKQSTDVAVNKARQPRAKQKLSTPILDRVLSRRLATAPAVKKERKPAALPVEDADDNTAKHPVFLAAHWLIKRMNPTELAYYRKRASSKNVPVINAVIADMLGFFNVQDLGIALDIKRNTSIINTSNGLRNKD